MKRQKSLKMKKSLFFVGFSILVLLAIFYFIKINVDVGSNFEVQDSLLGIIIFHNPFILGIYILVAVILIVKGLKK